MHQRVGARAIGGAIVVALMASILAACSDTAEKSTPAAAQTSLKSMASPTAGKSTSAIKSAAPATTVSLKLLQFVPAVMKVKAGDTVTWRSEENITHTVTFGTYAGTSGPSGLRTSEKPSGVFDRKLPGKGAMASHTYAKAGTYPYYCDIHKGMNATVVVSP